MRLWKNPKSAVCALLIFSLSCLLPSCGDVEVYEETRQMMGTFVQIKIVFDKAEKKESVFDAAFKEIMKVDRLMSAYRDDSQLSMINRYAGIKPVVVDRELIEVLEKSILLSNATGGAYDITAGELIDLWGFYKKNGHVPSAAEIEETLKRVDYRKIIINREKSTVFLKDELMSIDLGSIAKGFAVDQAAKKLRIMGVSGALVNAGGDIYALGRKEVTPWKVGVRNPLNNSEEVYRKLIAEDAAVVTSGCYHRYIELNGKKYCHIIDANTGMPVEGVLSVTVIAESTATADALATSVMLLGSEAGLKLIEDWERCEGLIIYKADDNTPKTARTSNFHKFLAD